MTEFADVLDIERTEVNIAPPIAPRRDKAARTLGLGTSSLLALAVAGCGGGGGGSSGPPTSVTPPSPPPAPTVTEAQGSRFLAQSSLAATSADISAVRSRGLAAWLTDQYATTNSSTAVAWLDSQGYGVADANQYFFNTNIADWVMWNQLMTAPDGFRKRIAIALSEFFVISTTGISGTAWIAYLIANYWDTLNNLAFGNFRDLLEAVTLDPGMGIYLNTKGNLKANAASGRAPDENYAREVMQLFSIGLFKLNNDGTTQNDSAGKPVPTYTQDDIVNLARVFTGYDYDYSADTNVTVTLASGRTQTVPTNNFTKRPMLFRQTNHSPEAATFLGVTIAAGHTGAASLKTALDTLFNHANVGPFFGKQMIQRLVTSNPSPAYVARVAAAFNNNGNGVRGDLRAVWTAILTDSEATTIPTSTSAGKIREPMLRLVQFARTVGVTSATNKWLIPDLSDSGTQLGQSPFRSPSVFNFFRPGYVPSNTTIGAAGLLAPEFQIVSESSVTSYLNYLLTFMTNGQGDVKPDYSQLLSLAPDSQALIDWVNLRFASNQLSAATVAAIKAALDATSVTATSTDAQKTTRIQNAIYLVMASNEYLVQK